MSNLVKKTLTVQGAHGTHRQTYYVAPQEGQGVLRLKSGEKVGSTRTQTVAPAERISVHYGLLWSKRANAGVNEAVRAIGAVHTVPKDLYKIPIKVTGSLAGANGIYKVWQPFGGNEINVSKWAFGPASTAAHEYGHFLDHHLFGNGQPRLNGFGTGQRGNKELAPLMEAMYRSKAIREVLKKHDEHGKNGNYHGRDVTNYLLMPQEVFARSYAQYIGLRGSKQIHREVHDYGTQWRSHGYSAQWEDKDFEPIAREFDRLFANRRLSRVRGQS
jgi:hypothetical protein